MFDIPLLTSDLCFTTIAINALLLIAMGLIIAFRERTGRPRFLSGLLKMSGLKDHKYPHFTGI